MEIYYLIALVCVVSVLPVVLIMQRRAGNGAGGDKAAEQINRLTAECATHKANAENLRDQIEQQRTQYEERIKRQAERHKAELDAVCSRYETRIDGLEKAGMKQMAEQFGLLQVQLKATSETVLKSRGEELEKHNREQVSRIVDPLNRSLQDMKTALDNSKKEHKEVIDRLDQTIKDTTLNSKMLGEEARRLYNALTGEVKVQGNFGELKLRQLLEGMELKEGEQFDTQETLRDRYGSKLKGDDGRGMVPDFILHFPNNRHVVVDSKMSFTAFEGYMNETLPERKSELLKEHLDSVRKQVRLLARKDYTRYLPEGYNRLDFAIMYVPIEGALNLALANDPTLWRDAYNEGVLVLGPQTMYMNLRVLEMMWTQVRQVENQDKMIAAAQDIIERVQLFGERFLDVEKSLSDTADKMRQLKITTSAGGRSIITAAKKLVEAGAAQNNKKRSLDDFDRLFLDGEKA